MSSRSSQSTTGSRLAMVLVVAIISFCLYSIFMDPGHHVQNDAAIRRTQKNLREITQALRTYANEHDGLYPSQNPNGTELGNSTEVFNRLIDAGYLMEKQPETEEVWSTVKRAKERVKARSRNRFFSLEDKVQKPEVQRPDQLFWVKNRHPDKMKPPNNDGHLDPSENVYGYVSGLTDTSFSLSPLVFDGLMDSPGVFGPYHPWLQQKKALVGFVDTHVAIMNLTTDQPGATILDDSGKIQNLFEKRIYDPEEHESSGGWLDGEAKSILLP